MTGFRGCADERFPFRQHGMIGWWPRPRPKPSPLRSIFGMSGFQAWCIMEPPKPVRDVSELALRFQVLEESSRQRSFRRPHPTLTERLPLGIRKSCPIITRNRSGSAPSGIRGFRRGRHAVEFQRTCGTVWYLRLVPAFPRRCGWPASGEAASLDPDLQGFLHFTPPFGIPNVDPYGILVDNVP